LKIPFIKIGLVEWRNVKALSSSPSTEKNKTKPKKTPKNKTKQKTQSKKN
jgi:hypothetical protein